MRPGTSKTAHIANSPYFRGYTVPTRRIGATGRSSKIFSTASSSRWPPTMTLTFPSLSASSKDQTPGPMPHLAQLSASREDLNNRYHRLTLELGPHHRVLGEDPAEFFRYFGRALPRSEPEPQLRSECFYPRRRRRVCAAYERFDAQNVGTHIDGPPFVALLINDRPGLQVVAGRGDGLMHRLPAARREGITTSP